MTPTKHLEEPSVRESVRYLRKDMRLTESDLAEGTGASTRTVRRWLAAEDPNPQQAHARSLDDLRAIVQELEESLTPKGIGQWLRARNRYLDGERPITMIREGRYGKVREAAIAFREGDYV